MDVTHLQVYKQRYQKNIVMATSRPAFSEFETCYDEQFQHRYGFYRQIISHVVHKYLECGDLHRGFARIKYPDCQHEYLVAFSCGGRWFPESRSSFTFPVDITSRWCSSGIISKRHYCFRFRIDNMFLLFRRSSVIFSL